MLSKQKLLNNKTMWTKYDNFVSKLKNGEEISVDALKFCVATVYLTAKINSCERPGAMWYLTIEEVNKETIIETQVRPLLYSYAAQNIHYVWISKNQNWLKNETYMFDH